MRLISRGLGLPKWSHKDGMLTASWESDDTMTLKLDVDKGKHQFVLSMNRYEVDQIVRMAKAAQKENEQPK